MPNSDLQKLSRAITDVTVELAAAYVNGVRLVEPDRTKLLQDLKTGSVVELDIEAVTYAVGPEITNVNLSDLAPAALKQFARTAKDTPFSRDHRTSTQDIGGFVLGSRVEKDGKTSRLVENIRLNEEWAVKGALNGNMKKFSIHWDPGSIQNVFCSVCNESLDNCWHTTGEVVTKGKKELVVSYIHQEARSVERSWVFDPAVQATEMRSQFLSAIHNLRANQTPKDNIMDLEKLAAMLGCEPTEQSVQNALKASIAMCEDRATQVTGLQTQVAALTGELANLKTELENHKSVSLETAAAKLIDELCRDYGLVKEGSMAKLIKETYVENAELGARLAETVKADWKLRPEPMQSKTVGEPIVGGPANRLTTAKAVVGAITEKYPHFLASPAMAALARDEPKKFLELHPTAIERVQPGTKLGDLV